jgi:hypothetical protein
MLDQLVYAPARAHGKISCASIVVRCCCTEDVGWNSRVQGSGAQTCQGLLVTRNFVVLFYHTLRLPTKYHRSLGRFLQGIIASSSQVYWYSKLLCLLPLLPRPRHLDARRCLPVDLHSRAPFSHHMVSQKPSLYHTDVLYIW